MCDLDHGCDGYGTSFADKVIACSRVPHRCEECSRMIPVGSTYVVTSGIWEGEFYYLKMCNRCRKAARWLMARGHGWIYGSILSDVRHCVEQELLEKKV